MTRPIYVFDTGALIAYAGQDEKVGQILVDTADLGLRVTIPVICLVEAYRQLDHDEHELLGPLRTNRAVDVSGVDTGWGQDAAPTIGAMTRHTGRLGASHAVWIAMAAGGAVVTSHPAEMIPILGEGWPIIEV